MPSSPAPDTRPPPTTSAPATWPTPTARSPRKPPTKIKPWRMRANAAEIGRSTSPRRSTPSPRTRPGPLEYAQGLAALTKEHARNAASAAEGETSSDQVRAKAAKDILDHHSNFSGPWSTRGRSMTTRHRRLGRWSLTDPDADGEVHDAAWDEYQGQLETAAEKYGQTIKDASIGSATSRPPRSRPPRVLWQPAQQQKPRLPPISRSSPRSRGKRKDPGREDQGRDDHAGRGRGQRRPELCHHAGLCTRRATSTWPIINMTTDKLAASSQRDRLKP